MNLKQFTKIVRLHKEYALLWSKTGLVGFQSDSIQVTEQAFAKIREMYPEAEITLWLTEEKTGQYPYEAQLMVEDTVILTIGSAKEFEAIGIDVSQAMHKPEEEMPF